MVSSLIYQSSYCNSSSFAVVIQLYSMVNKVLRVLAKNDIRNANFKSLGVWLELNKNFLLPKSVWHLSTSATLSRKQSKPKIQTILELNFVRVNVHFNLLFIYLLVQTRLIFHGFLFIRKLLENTSIYFSPVYCSTWAYLLKIKGNIYMAFLQI